LARGAILRRTPFRGWLAFKTIEQPWFRHPSVVAAIYIRKFGELDLRKQTENIDFMSASSQPSTLEPEDIETAADQAIAACGGIAREAVKALIVANSFLEVQIAELRAAVSMGYSRGR
jgi:hypothetical protein